MVLVGNKTDLHMERRVTTDEGKALAEEMKAAFLETSAKENRVCIRSTLFLKLFCGISTSGHCWPFQRPLLHFVAIDS